MIEEVVIGMIAEMTAVVTETEMIVVTIVKTVTIVMTVTSFDSLSPLTDLMF